MKPKLIWPIASLVLGLLMSPCSVQAGFLEDIAGNNAGQAKTYTYSVPQTGQVRPSGGVQYPGAAGYTQPRPAPQQPIRHQIAAPRVAYQQPMLQAQEIPQQKTVPKAATKKAKKAGTVKAAPKPRQPVASARPYQPNYGQVQQTGYYANPYQSQYTAYPNYYQGYYDNWGASGQACPPGKA